jgi:hypothetical protein
MESPEEIEFRKLLDIELDKINSFYAEREIEIVNKLILIVQQIEIYSNTETKKSSYKPIDAFIGVFSHKKKESFSKDLESSDPSIYNDVKFKSKKAKSKLKNALLELYREMFLLKNYKILNYTGFVKILKKYDKIMKRNLTLQYISKVEHSHFHSSKVLEKVIKQTENIYIKTFRHGNRNDGMNDLRLPDETVDEQHSVIWRAGFCLGLALPIIYSIISKFINEDLGQKIDNLEIILQIFGGLSLPIIFLLLFGVNLIVWKKYKINYVFIFEFDSRNHLTPWEFIEIACLLFVLWIYFVYFAITNFFSFITTHLYPVILIFIYLGLLLLPFNVFYYQARQWIIKVIIRLICAPFYYVRFADFFLGDQFMSISYIFTVIEILFCAEFYSFKNMELKCNSSRSWFISIVTVVPGWIRFLQCLRRYYNTHHFNPHLLNAGKYLVGIVSILLGTFAKVNGHLYLRIIWIISLVATTTYSYTWDILMDWGFFQKNSKNKFLRDDLIFPTWTYYYVMISNLFLRTIWLFTVSPNYWGVIKNGNIVAYATALIEVFRRFQWNFFRMENEHTNNCGEFRAVKEMPLPYNINNNSDDDDDNPSHYDTINDSSTTSGSNLQNFVKKFNKSKSTMDDGLQEDRNNNKDSHTIDITNMKDMMGIKDKDRDNTNINNISKDNDFIRNNSFLHRTCLNGNNSHLKHSHSQESIHLKKNCRSPIESDSFNISTIKFWNIKPSDFIKCSNYNNNHSINSMINSATINNSNNNNSTISGNFDFQDPLNSNRTIHTYSVDSEFNQYISRVKENLSSLDTIINHYDHKQDRSNQLSIKIENFTDNSNSNNNNNSNKKHGQLQSQQSQLRQTLNIFDFHNHHYQNNINKDDNKDDNRDDNKDINNNDNNDNININININKDINDNNTDNSSDNNYYNINKNHHSENSPPPSLFNKHILKQENNNSIFKSGDTIKVDFEEEEEEKEKEIKIDMEGRGVGGGEREEDNNIDDDDNSKDISSLQKPQLKDLFIDSDKSVIHRSGDISSSSLSPSESLTLYSVK